MNFGVFQLDNSNCFYTYVYLDTRKPGSYTYGKYKFEYAPLYVGKGKGKRYKTHIWRCENTHLKRKIDKIRKLGKEPIVIKVEDNIVEKKAIQLEIDLIRCIGLDNLTNHTLGGDGVSGYKHSEELKGRNRLAHLGYKHTEDTIRRIANTLKQTWKNKDSQEKIDFANAISKRMRGKSNPNFGRIFSEEYKKKLREAKKKQYENGYINPTKGRHHTAEAKRKLSNSHMGAKNGMYGKTHTRETKQKLRELTLKHHRMKLLECDKKGVVGVATSD